MPSYIERFRRLNIRRIFTIRPHSESSQDWDEEANQIIDNEHVIRRRIEIVDHPSADLLQYLHDLVQELDIAIESGERVYVHWYIFSF